MKSLVLTLLVALSGLSLAQASSPLIAVQNTIRHANQGDVVGIDLKEAKMTKAQVLALLKGVDVDKAVFVGWNGEQNNFWMVDEKDPKLFHLRMANPRCIGFKVRFMPNEDKKGEGRYLVVAIQP